MSGPWYEVESPNLEYVIKDITNLTPKFKELFKSKTEEEIKKAINTSIENQLKNNNNSFGSYRGYATFARPEIITEIKKLLSL